MAPAGQGPLPASGARDDALLREKASPCDWIAPRRGGGPGRDTIEPPKLDYDVVPYDLTPESIFLAKRRIARAGVKRRVRDVVEGSIADLSRYPSSQFDAVLCLGGALPHVDGADRRLQAVGQLARAAKLGAPVFISVIRLLAVLTESPRFWPTWIGATAKLREAWQIGDNRHWCGTSYAHFSPSHRYYSAAWSSRGH